MANVYENSFQNIFDSGLFAFDSTTGQIIPQTSDVKNAVRAALIEAFGTNLNTEDESPAGRLIEMWTLMMTRFCSITALYANQLNPQYATGQMLDAIGALFSVKRNARTPSVISCIYNGTPGTWIAQGSRISDNQGHVFLTDQRIQLVAGGVAGTATCASVGPIVVENNTVTTILDTVDGWEYVTNTTMVSVGYDLETDYHFRKRVLDARWTGTAFLEDIRAELNRVNGVDSVFVAENGEGDMRYLIQNMAICGAWNSDIVYSKGDSVLDNNEGYECIKSLTAASADDPASDTDHWKSVGDKYIQMPGHSIVVIVSGPAASSDIAYAIYATKSAGCAMTRLDAAGQEGTAKGIVVTQPIVDADTGVVYTITYNEPISVPFSVNVEVRKNKFIGTDTELIAAVKEAVASWANGEYPYVDGIQMGQSIYSYEIGAAISDAIPAIQIQNVKLTQEGESPADTIPLFVYELGTLDRDSIQVTVS